MKIFDYKFQANIIEDKIRKALASKTHFKDKLLVIIQIGNDLSSSKFIDIKIKLCEKLGVGCKVYKIDEKKSDEFIFNIVHEIFADEKELGGIIQLPLPRKSLYKVLDLIPVDKDVDVISTERKRRFYEGDFFMLPPTVKALESFINSNIFDLVVLFDVVF